MARTPSTMLALGTTAPDFSLPEPATGKTVSLNNFQGQPLLVAFICNHCPYVLHIQNVFARFAEEYQAKGVAVVAINANDVANYPDDSPEKMIQQVNDVPYTFPYLFDESQQVAKAYQAACTPDFFLFDAHHKLYYRGQFDGSRPRNDEPITGQDMRDAVDSLLAGMAAPENQVASLGCNIKWKAGNAPRYF
ncbi:thioredoxin family protein [Thiolinea disciformis]|uniref:thioredoxin family protein n=1 Tax=Thiolinea disciformis TaxID=125614 RepID=UPI000372EFAC|nr:thioredoxin family protein [Thiolinea disciformis]